MTTLTRRQLLQCAGAGAAALAFAPLTAWAADEPPFTVPKLPYAYDALEPYIDAETMKIHHDLHHGAYVTNLNTALKDQPEIAKKGIVAILRDYKSLPETIRQAVINNGGGHVNHTMFWEIMKNNPNGKPSGELAKAIDSAFGSFDKFQTAMNDAGAKRFGSGWAWLVLNNGKLDVISSANQDSPYMNGQSPIMGIDVWEHAYYLKYKNKRPDYLKAWWNVVNWDTVADRYSKALKAKA